MKWVRGKQRQKKQGSEDRGLSTDWLAEFKSWLCCVALGQWSDLFGRQFLHPQKGDADHSAQLFMGCVSDQ